MIEARGHSGHVFLAERWHKASRSPSTGKWVLLSMAFDARYSLVGVSPQRKRSHSQACDAGEEVHHTSSATHSTAGTYSLTYYSRTYCLSRKFSIVALPGRRSPASSAGDEDII